MMTSEERFEKIEEALEDLTDIVRVLANGQQELREQQARTQTQIDALAEAQRQTNETQRIILESLGTMAQSQAQLAQQVSIMQSQVTTMQSQIIGLQLENRRMIERFSRGDNPPQ